MLFLFLPKQITIMRILTRDDIIDTYSKIIQRGSSFIFSKFTLNKKSRTISAFDDTAFQTSNWWIIPAVKERWNKLITGNTTINYEQHLIDNYIKNESGLRLLSLGSGSCSHELELAKYPQFDKILCVDIAPNGLEAAKKNADAQQLTNIDFLCTDIMSYDFKKDYFDFVLFNASLHHFEDVHTLLKDQVKNTLKVGGKLVINEFVGPKRLQYPKHQVKAVNQALKLIDKPYRRRYKTNLLKNSFSGSGVIRMIIADPSECVDSSSILPAIHKNFKTIEEKPYGGNILMNVLKDISHHFVNPDTRRKEILKELFAFEDAYLKENQSDFVFGIYQK